MSNGFAALSPAPRMKYMMDERGATAAGNLTGSVV
jgi:hypothetical protein